MIPAHAIGYGATFVVAAAAGWFLHAPGAAPVARTVPTATTATTAAPRPAAGTPAPLIVVASDGTATLRVEQQPLEWVLEQIAQQSGWGDVRARAAAAPRTAPDEAAPLPVEAVCADPSTISPADSRRTLQAIEHGSESDRFDGLLQAGAEGTVVPEAMLRTLVEIDPSERVRLMALERIAELRSGEPDALRTTLEAALYVPNAAVQQEARRRLDELRESAQADAGSGQPDAAP
jgi:hypothetical protein